MSKIVFTIQTKNLAQLIGFIVFIAIFCLVVAMLITTFVTSEKALIILISSCLGGFFGRYLIKFMTTTTFNIIVDDQILSVEEKTSRGKIKGYTVNLTDVDKLYYIDHSRGQEIVSLKIKLVDSNNQTKLQIRSSKFEAVDGMGKRNIENLVALSTLIFDKLNIDIKSKAKYHFMSNLREYIVNKNDHLG